MKLQMMPSLRGSDVKLKTPFIHSFIRSFIHSFIFDQALRTSFYLQKSQKLSEAAYVMCDGDLNVG